MVRSIVMFIGAALTIFGIWWFTRPTAAKEEPKPEPKPTPEPEEGKGWFGTTTYIIAGVVVILLVLAYFKFADGKETTSITRTPT